MRDPDGVLASSLSAAEIAAELGHSQVTVDAGIHRGVTVAAR